MSGCKQVITNITPLTKWQEFVDFCYLRAPWDQYVDTQEHCVVSGLWNLNSLIHFSVMNSSLMSSSSKRLCRNHIKSRVVGMQYQPDWTWDLPGWWVKGIITHPSQHILFGVTSWVMEASPWHLCLLLCLFFAGTAQLLCYLETMK